MLCTVCLASVQSAEKFAEEHPAFRTIHTSGHKREEKRNFIHRLQSREYISAHIYNIRYITTFSITSNVGDFSLVSRAKDKELENYSNII